jgi:hypothetical protein
MYATATQPRIEYARHESTPLRDPQPTVPEPKSTPIAAAFMEQHGVGRLEELVETLDFPLDFQI